MARLTVMDESHTVSLFEQCSNQGRRGRNDELGTLNHITLEKRVAAARLVQTGEAFLASRRVSSCVTQPERWMDRRSPFRRDHVRASEREAS